jgi:hypothetical protein
VAVGRPAGRGQEGRRARGAQMQGPQTPYWGQWGGGGRTFGARIGVGSSGQHAPRGLSRECGEQDGDQSGRGTECNHMCVWADVSAAEGASRRARWGHVYPGRSRFVGDLTGDLQTTLKLLLLLQHDLCKKQGRRKRLLAAESDPARAEPPGWPVAHSLLGGFLKLCIFRFTAPWPRATRFQGTCSAVPGRLRRRSRRESLAAHAWMCTYAAPDSTNHRHSRTAPHGGHRRGDHEEQPSRRASHARRARAMGTGVERLLTRARHICTACRLRGCWYGAATECSS